MPGWDSAAAIRQRHRMEARAAVEEDMMTRVQLSKVGAGWGGWGRQRGWGEGGGGAWWSRLGFVVGWGAQLGGAGVGGAAQGGR
jgi:hypothetical protein